MRSTGFVIISITIHLMCVAAIALTPTQTVTSSGDNIEVKIDATADKPGIPQADAKVEDTQPQAQAPEAKTDEVKKPAPTIKAAPVKKLSQSKTAKPKVAVTELPKKEKVPETMDPVVEDKDTVAVVKTEESKVTVENKDTEKTPETEEAPKSDDSKVAAAPESDAPAAETLETAPAPEETPAADPTSNSTEPAPAKDSSDDSAAAAPTMATPTATVTSTKATQESTPQLAKGGASKDGAVSYTDLKQLPGNKAPNYPIHARLENRQGQLELLYRVTKDGKVADISVAKSSGYKDLDEAALGAISQFRFVPGQEGWARHPVNFYLKGPVATLPSQLRGKGAQAD